MLLPLDSPAVLLEGKTRLWVTGEYCYMNREVQLPQDQADDLTAVGFGSYPPRFLYSYVSKTHAFIK